MSKEDISKLRSLRGAYKGHCTQDVKRAERMIAEDADESELTSLLDRLTRRSEEIETMDNKIIMTLEGTDIEREAEAVLSFQDNVSVWIHKLKMFIEMKRTVRSIQTSNLPNSQQPSHDSMNIHLPKINIKAYGGSPLEFQAFWDHYNAMIHSNAKLNSIQKFNYLHGLLEGDAGARNRRVSIDNK